MPKKQDPMMKQKQEPKKVPPKRTLSSYIFTALLVFAILSALYSLIADVSTKKPGTVALSEVAHLVSAGEVKTITVTDQELTITKKDDTKVESKKESGTSLGETLASYGVTPAQLQAVEVDVVTQSGFWYVVLNLLPIVLPVALIIFFFWMLSRQAKGAGMQAFSFGQSKARVTDPTDKNNSVTFKDVAGAREAKEELKEIVDFLRNPKKFLDIGARIPKGVLLTGSPGTGKCVTGDTQLVTTKGLVKIQDVPKFFSVQKDNTVDGLDIVTLDANKGALRVAGASHWYNLGEQETVSITTDMGISVEGTFEHPIVVIDKETGHFTFKPLNEIEEGDWTVVGHNTQTFGHYTSLPSAEAAYLLGVLTGDGCLTIKDRVCVTIANPEIMERVQNSMTSLFGTSFSKTASRPYDYEIRSVEVKQKLLEWGLQETYARHKKIPDWVQFAPKEFVVAFLQGLFDTDGSVERKGSVSYSSASKDLITGVHLALINLGVVARRYQRKKRYNNQLQYYIAVYGDFVPQFQKEIGFTVQKKKDRLLQVCEKQRNTNVNVVPLQQSVIKSVWERVRSTSSETFNRSFYRDSLYKNVKRYIAGDRQPSHLGMNTMLDTMLSLSPVAAYMPEVAHLRTLASGKFFFTKVSEKKYGKATVYDLTVPVTHNFIANGLINHNTLLARAVAGEAGVPFFHLSGSEFVEMFVGVGASRVRDLFKMAKRAAPAIIFVDEIDAVGRVRGGGYGGGNDEREQTLNQILVEMDGFEPNDKVIVMAATNRSDVLDPALLRPGRFDRRVTLDLPDRRDREEILKVHAQKKPLGEDVNLTTIAERTPGFSGADLASLMNEGAILAARENRKKVSQFDLVRSIEKVMLGPERKSHLMTKHEKDIVAYHEAGHALVASVLPDADPVHKVTIVARGRAGGFTMKIPLEERKLQSRKEFLDDIAMSLGGYAAEELVFGDITTGPSGDLQTATNLARAMVTRWGMSDAIGPLALESDGGQPILGVGPSKEYSEKAAALIDSEVEKIMKEAKIRATEVLTKHRKILDSIAVRLIEVETLEQQEYEMIISAHGIPLKKKETVVA